MQAGKPSITAWGAAVHRAAHQVFEQGRIFADPLALRILGKDAEAAVRDAQDEPARRRMRIFIAIRTRYAEDALAASLKQDVRQLIVLGAGLDTFAYRHTFQDSFRIFEVDHPVTQPWKRDCLNAAAIPVPKTLTFAPVDFEHQTLAEGLGSAGFDASAPTFFTWLGVVPYLTEEAVWTTLRFVAGLAGGAQVVFDYSDPPASLPAEWRTVHQKRAARVAELGEAWLTYFDAETLRTKLMALGFSEVEDLGPSEIAARFLPHRALALPDKGGHIMRASTLPKYVEKYTPR